MVTAVTVHGSVRLVNGLLARFKVVIIRRLRFFWSAEHDCLASLKEHTRLSQIHATALAREQVALCITRLCSAAVSESEVLNARVVVTGVLEVRDLLSPL